MLKMIQMAERYPVEKPRALREAGYYTAVIGKNHFHPQRNGHGYHQMLLDESGRIESPEYRSDYRSWFWSQAPHLDPDATGLGWNDYRARPYALPSACIRPGGRASARLTSSKPTIGRSQCS